MAVVQGEEQSELLSSHVNSGDFDSLSIPANHLINNGIKNTEKFKNVPFGQPNRSHRLHQTSCCLPQCIPTSRRLLFHAACTIHIFLALALLVTIPEYYRTIALVGSDAFSGAYLVVFLSTLVLGLLLGLRKFWDPNFVFWHFLPVQMLIRDATLFSLGLLGCAYARGSDHGVPCHLQDGLLFLGIPIAIIYMSFKKYRDMMSKNARLISLLTIFLALVFLSVIPQLSYRFACRGVELEVHEEEDHEQNEHHRSLWIGAYVVCIGLVTCSACGFLSSVHDHEDSSDRCFEWTGWFHLLVLAILSALFWTDFVFPSMGGADTVGEFWSNFSSIWAHHFGGDEVASQPARLGWALTAFWLFFLYTSNLLVYRFHSNPVHVLCNGALALTLLPIFYSLFTFEAGRFQFRLAFTLGGYISLILLLPAYFILAAYQAASVLLNLLDGFDIY